MAMKNESIEFDNVDFIHEAKTDLYDGGPDVWDMYEDKYMRGNKGSETEDGE